MIRCSLTLALFAILLTGCSTRNVPHYDRTSESKHTAATPAKSTYKHPTMRPYTVHGKRYHPTVVRQGEIFDGRASWYGPAFHGKLTSNGETYDMHSMTAAHKTLPMNTIVKVDNLDNGLSAVVRINDRGPFVETRIIDLSKKAAKSVDMLNAGTARVRLTILGFEQKGSKKISDIRELRAGPSEVVLGKFAVQIASFTKIDGAFKTQEKYDGFQGYHTTIKDNELNDKRLFRVWLSGFKSEAEARDFIQSSTFENAFIVRE